MEWPNETEIAELCEAIGSYCTQNGYHLGKVFVDRGVSADVFARIGFIDLVDAVRAAAAAFVVVPSVEHLSTDSFVHDALRRMIAQASSEAVVLVMRDNNGGGWTSGASS